MGFGKGLGSFSIGKKKILKPGTAFNLKHGVVQPYLIVKHRADLASQAQLHFHRVGPAATQHAFFGVCYRKPNGQDYEGGRAKGGDV